MPGHYDLESLLRYAWYLDFGVTPEQTPAAIARQMGVTRNPTCDISTSHLRMSLSDMLTKFESHILAEAKRCNIDARAVAGAISWEYEVNWKGRHSDRFQFNNNSWGGYSLTGGNIIVGGANAGIGWGSIHTEAAKTVRPGSTPAELQCLRMKAGSAISMVADVIDRAARNYFDLTDGIWARDNPPVLAMFFNTSDKFLAESAKRRKDDPGKKTGMVTLVVKDNPMGQWVHDNLARFAKFKTVPTPPAGRYYKVAV